MNHSPDLEIKSAPRGFFPMFLTLGPGIVLAGGVVGSGELINTPVQAATFGFVLLWAVIFSCLIKYFLQIEVARHCLVHDRTPFEAMNLIPGPKLFHTSWVVYLFMAAWTFAAIGAPGIVGAMAGVLQRVMPLNQWLGNPEGFDEVRSVQVWGIVLVVAVGLLLGKGVYSRLEKLIVVLVIGFSLTVVVALVMLQGTDHRITGSDIATGLWFSLGEPPADLPAKQDTQPADKEPIAEEDSEQDLGTQTDHGVPRINAERYNRWKRAAAVAVIALMGGLGVTGLELLLYPHWVREKGYPRFLGPPASAGWEDRAKGWVRMLKVDALVATLLATVVTTAFFLLGAAILYRQGLKPEGIAVVDTISATFTEVYGEWSRSVFLIGAMLTLLSTMLAAPAANGRFFTDFFCSLGIVNRDHREQTRRSTQIMQWVYLLSAGLLYLFMPQQPEKLVILSHYVIGLAGTPIAILAICWMAFHTDRRLRMNKLTAVIFMVTVVVILACLGIGFAVQRGWIAAA